MAAQTALLQTFSKSVAPGIRLGEDCATRPNMLKYNPAIR